MTAGRRDGRGVRNPAPAPGAAHRPGRVCSGDRGAAHRAWRTARSPAAAIAARTSSCRDRRRRSRRVAARLGSREPHPLGTAALPRAGRRSSSASARPRPARRWPRSARRIARELHDVVAHCLSVMAVQAGRRGDARRRAPARARSRSWRSQETGRSALAEMRRMLGVLRETDDEAPGRSRPQPGLASLDRLVGELREAGLPVALASRATRSAAARRRPLRVPDRPGGAHQRRSSTPGPARAWVTVAVRARRGRAPGRATTGRGPTVAGTPTAGTA